MQEHCLTRTDQAERASAGLKITDGTECIALLRGKQHLAQPQNDDLTMYMIDYVLLIFQILEKKTSRK